jgi:hypothetical protein
MSIIRVHVSEFRVQPPSADNPLMLVCAGYNSDQHAPENTCSRDVLSFDGSVEELRSFAQAILDALPEAGTKQSEPIDFRAYQGIPDDIPWL